MALEIILRMSLLKKHKVPRKERKQIDQWLKDKGLNQFGDNKSTVYTGGTPLFDESSGKTTDRYEHIVSRNPDKPWHNYK